MADVVNVQKLFDGERKCIFLFTDKSDGTGEAAVTKVTASTLAAASSGMACNAVSPLKIRYSCDGIGVDILFGATSDALAFHCAKNTQAEVSFAGEWGQDGGIGNFAAAGKTGNIKFTTTGAGAGSEYTITIEFLKHYANFYDTSANP